MARLGRTTMPAPWLDSDEPAVRTTSEDDLSRLKALCSIHGVGLVTFTLDKAAPDYTVVVLPMQASPDMFYANQMLRRLLDSSAELFDKLF